MKLPSLIILGLKYLLCWLSPQYEQLQKWSPSESNPWNINQRHLLINTRHQFSMIVDSKDETVSKTLVQQGAWQSHNIRLIKKIVKQGDYVLNIGSQVGNQAIFMGKQIGTTGKLYVFQPFSKSYQILRKNIYLNDLQDRVKTYKLGASNSQQIGKMAILNTNTGGSKVWSPKELNQQSIQDLQKNKDFQQEGWGQYQYVTLNKIDNVLPKDQKFNFALIDVETMQIPVLDGLKQTIKRSPNLVIFVEWSYQQSKDQILGKQVINFLWERGYTFYQLYGQPKCFAPELQSKTIYQNLRSVRRADFLLIPKGVNINI